MRDRGWEPFWDGFTELDLVAHNGSRSDGEFAHSLNVTDRSSGHVVNGNALPGVTVVFDSKVLGVSQTATTDDDDTTAAPARG